MVARTQFILSVEQDISRVSEVNEWDILLSTGNKFHISKHTCNVLFISGTFTKNLNFYANKVDKGSLNDIFTRKKYRVFTRVKIRFFSVAENSVSH